MGYIGRQPTNAILTSDDIAAGSVSKDKVNFISNGTAGLTVKGDGGSNDGDIALNCRVNSHGIKLKSPSHSSSQSYTLTFPTTSPSAKLHVQGSTLSDTLSTSNSATFGGDARLQSDLSTLNKAQSAYIDLATRDTSGSEVVYNLENIGSASFAGDITAVFDSNNSGNRLRIADTEGVSAAVRTYSTSDGTGLILNHYFAVAGSPYMRYSDFVSNMDDEAATTMRFLTKPHSGNPTVALTIDNSQDATFSGDVIVTGTNGLKIGTTSDLQSSSEIFSLEGGLAVMRNSSDSAATLYVQNHSTTADTIQPYIYFTDTGGNRGGIGIEYTTAKVTLNGQGGLRLTTGTSGVSGTEALVIDTNQKVGIGTFPQYNLTGPSAALHVVKDSGTSVTAVARFREINQTSKTTRIQLEDRSGSISDGIIDLVVPNETADNSYLGIGCNDSTQLVLANGGNVGIGTTSPDSKLEVITTSTNSAIELDNSDTDYTFIQYNAQGVTKGFAGFNSSYMMFGGESGTDTSLQAGGQIALTVKNDTQNVGIGTTSPNFKLDIVNAAASTATYQQFRNGTTGTASSDGTVLGIDADGDFLINNQEAKEIKLYTSDTQRLTIDSTGSVGIGISAPTQKLDVRGG